MATNANPGRFARPEISGEADVARPQFSAARVVTKKLEKDFVAATQKSPPAQTRVAPSAPASSVSPRQRGANAAAAAPNTIRISVATTTAASRAAQQPSAPVLLSSARPSHPRSPATLVVDVDEFVQREDAGRSPRSRSSLLGGPAAAAVRQQALVAPPPSPGLLSSHTRGQERGGSPFLDEPSAAALTPLVDGVGGSSSPLTQDAGSHAECTRRLAELELLLEEERAGRESDRAAAHAHELESVTSAVLTAVPPAVAAAVSKLELRVAELQHALEAEKLRSVELDTALMQAESVHEREKGGWLLERQGLLAESEAGFAGLARAVSDRAEASVVALRAELQRAASALETERTRASGLHADSRAVEAAVREEARRQAAGAVEAATRHLRVTLERERQAAAADQDLLQGQAQALVREADAARASLLRGMEEETARVIEAAQAEAVSLRAVLQEERARHSAAEDTMQREYDAQCKTFESRLRAKVSRTISLLRQANQTPGSDLTAILSPLMTAVAPPQVVHHEDQEARGGFAVAAQWASSPAQPPRVPQPAFGDSPPAAAGLSALGSPPAAAVHGRTDVQVSQAAAKAAGFAAGMDAANKILGRSGGAASAVCAPSVGSAGQEAASPTAALGEKADKLLAAADDVLATVLRNMSPEQRQLWAAIEYRMMTSQGAFAGPGGL